MTIKAEYIWIDGTKPTAQIRSKTRILSANTPSQDPPVWGFDGSSTNQAEGFSSDCVLRPVKTYKDPIRGGKSILVLCEVDAVEGMPHKSNTRHKLAGLTKTTESHELWFGLEQEYTFVDLDGSPYGFKRAVKHGALPRAQGPYYCGSGHGIAVGRDLVEHHLDLCLKAKINISGINAEVMPGQWEFQVGPSDPVTASDDLWVARYLLLRVGEMYDVGVSFDGKPADGGWNGAGCHTNFSTKKMRSSYEACEKAAEALRKNHQHHINNYGAGIEKRLTGEYETCSYKEFRWGVSDRGASIRIPWQVVKEKKGYIEDRRPNANCDPYIVIRLIIESVCVE
jgi:glutamine synthetase